MTTAEIRGAMAKARAKGWTIKTGFFVDWEARTCCALGAVIVTESRKRPHVAGNYELAAEALGGLDPLWVEGFADGFDRLRWGGSKSPVYREAREAGLSVAIAEGVTP